MKYQATIKILVEGEDNYSRATEHWLHAIVQEGVGEQCDETGLSIVGASCVDVKKLED